MAPDRATAAVELPSVFALLLFFAVPLEFFFLNTDRYFHISYYEFDPPGFNSDDHIHSIY